MSFPIGVPLEPNHYLQRFSRYLHPNIWVMTLTFLGHVTSSVTWPCHSPGVISYSCSIVTVSLSPTIFEIIGIFYIWVTTLTFMDHVTYRHVTNRSAICHFLLMSHCNGTSITNRFRDILPPLTHPHTRTPQMILLVLDSIQGVPKKWHSLCWTP